MTSQKMDHSAPHTHTPLPSPCGGEKKKKENWWFNIGKKLNIKRPCLGAAAVSLPKVQKELTAFMALEIGGKKYTGQKVYLFTLLKHT